MSSFLKGPSLNKVAKLKLKKFKNSVTLYREFQSLSYYEALSFNCLLLFVCALENRVRIKANGFHFIVWVYKFGLGGAEEMSVS